MEMMFYKLVFMWHATDNGPNTAQTIGAAFATIF